MILHSLRLSYHGLSPKVGSFGEAELLNCRCHSLSQATAHTVTTQAMRIRTESEPAVWLGCKLSMELVFEQPQSWRGCSVAIECMEQGAVA